MSRRTLILSGAAVAVVAAGALAVAVSSSSDQPADPTSTSHGTATVQRRDLVEVDEEDGTLGYADSREVVNRLSGTITWLPAGGRVIPVDHALLQVDDEPVVFLSGHSPAYRALSSSTSDGPDVAELERNLRSLGYDDGHAITLDDSWDAGTTAAVERWQKAHGLQQTGGIELGRVVFLPGTRRRVGTVDATLGGSASSSSPAGWDGGQGMFVPVVDTTATTPATAPTTTPTPTTPTATTPATTPTTPTTTPSTPTTPTTPATPKQKPSGPSETDGSLGGSGGNGDPGGPSTPDGSGGDGDGGTGDGSGTATNVMTTTSTRRQVTVDLATSKQTLARTGARVDVELPGGAVVRGTITSVGRVAKASDPGDDGAAKPSSGDDAATITVTIRLESATGSRLDQAPVTVRFVQSRRRHVLSVPVTALLALPGGRYAVQEVGSARSGPHLVPVTTGLYADGYVEISGSGIHTGMKVADATEAP